MSVSNVIRDEQEAHHWSVICSCLMEFHNFSSESARRKTSALQEKYESLAKDDIDLFYHHEPFNVANALAGQRLKIDTYLERYLELRDDEVVVAARPLSKRKAPRAKKALAVGRRLRKTG